MPLDTLEKPKSYYELLDVTPGASDEDIKRAYRKLALQYHPDRWRAQERHFAELRFRQINEAYAHVKTSEKRAVYNNRLRGENDNGNKGASFWDNIASIFRTPVSK